MPKNLPDENGDFTPVTALDDNRLCVKVAVGDDIAFCYAKVGANAKPGLSDNIWKIVLTDGEGSAAYPCKDDNVANGPDTGYRFAAADAATLNYYTPA